MKKTVKKRIGSETLLFTYMNYIPFIFSLPRALLSCHTSHRQPVKIKYRKSMCKGSPGPIPLSPIRFPLTFWLIVHTLISDHSGNVLVSDYIVAYKLTYKCREKKRNCYQNMLGSVHRFSSIILSMKGRVRAAILLKPAEFMNVQFCWGFWA